MRPVGGVGFRPAKLANPKGAEWIWLHIPPLLERLGCPNETYQLYDFYHVTEHLQLFADAAFTKENERKDWFKNARKTLKKRGALPLIKKMNKFINEASGERYNTMIKQRDYLLRAYREGRLNYPEIIEKKLPIGSGESTWRCRLPSRQTGEPEGSD
ncbi:hypothetical protein CAL7716_046280 [Calothrix sp. PCC 7716]|nr:hypothetical protein CAL7716_008040 [Calothrix sp. PCC 7716]BDA70462.1 hypothetical protein CAL7716_046280 [Calothrix sp. PCC 7716]